MNKLLWVLAIVAVAYVSLKMQAARATHTFDDVSSGSFFHEDVSWLAENGITGGCGNGNFCPSRPVTRGQMAAFMHRLVSVDTFAYVSADAESFRPVDSLTDYSLLNERRVRTSTNGSGVFTWPLRLPDLAVITGAVASVFDASGSVDIEDFFIGRTSLATQQPEGLFDLGSTSGSGGANLLFSTGSSTLVDNLEYAYWMQFTITGNDGAAVGVVGATVEYVSTGIPRP